MRHRSEGPSFDGEPLRARRRSPRGTRALIPDAALRCRRSSAELQILVVSDRRSAALALAHGLSHSERTIAFRWVRPDRHAGRSVLAKIMRSKPYLPTIVVIDFLCRGAAGLRLLQELRIATSKVPVEFVVTNVPGDAAVVRELTSPNTTVLLRDDADPPSILN